MASGIGGTGGGSRFPLPPGNGDKAKKVRFSSESSSDDETKPTVKAAVDAFNKLLTDGSAPTGGSSTHPIQPKHVVTKDLGARPKRPQGKKVEESSWIDIADQAAKAAQQWKQSRGGDKSSSMQGTDQTSDDLRPEVPPRLSSRSSGQSSISHETEQKPVVPPRTTSLLPSQEQRMASTSSLVISQSSSETSGPALPPQLGISAEQPATSFSESSRVVSQSSASASRITLPDDDEPVSLHPGHFVDIQMGLLELQLEHLNSMQESFRIVEDSAKSSADKQWCRKQNAKYEKDKIKLEKQLQKLKAAQEDEFDDVITNASLSARTNDMPRRIPSNQEIVASLDLGMQSVEELEELNQAFGKLAQSFQNSKLQFATNESHYQTPISQSHYQTPISQSHYQTPISRSHNKNDQTPISQLRDRNDLPPSSSLDDLSSSSDDDIISLDSDRGPVRSAETGDQVPYYSIRTMLTSVARAIRTGLAVICARIRAGFAAALEFIRRCCAHKEYDEESNEDVYQVLGYQDAHDYLTMQNRFRIFMQTSYGRDIHNQEFRIPRAQLNADLTALESVQALLRNEGGATASSRVSSQPNANLEPITSSYVLLDFPKPSGQQSSPRLSRSQSSESENVIYSEIQFPTPTPVGERVQDVLVRADGLWESLVTAEIPQGASTGRYLNLVQQLEGVLQDIDRVVNDNKQRSSDRSDKS